ncbi:MarR family winged helix-turn-helix transcriptional regulator [Actinacidiphila guanduensis]|uniref:MarR family protein n=1 Tax=Actinacidiphila guanduensis TaxID=310781 RepID=A0A1H0JE02_9ACTN|nr:MarR family transcriptional regulator [Actinacidiphila guanduensis]SDO41916.1 MarR family protein [Actinacidiphila guanduensis]
MATDETPEPDDPSEEGLWRPLWALFREMDGDIARLYREAEIEGVRTTWVGELLRLDRRGPMTIRELADSMGHSHSALSQKVAAMRAAGLVDTLPGEDARTKRVTLTDRARSVVGRLAAEWRATERASRELEAELPYPLSQVVQDMRQALERRSFHDRIAALLAEDPQWR